MRNKFNVYYQPPDEEYKKIWAESLFITDTSVLLGLYRYPLAIKDILINIFNTLGNRLWIPHQVGQEYYENRVKAIYDQVDAYDMICSTLTNSFEEFNKVFEKTPIRHPFIDSKSIKDEVQSCVEKIKGKLVTSKGEYPKRTSDDLILKQLEEIFNKRVGNPYDEEMLKKLYSEAEINYSRNVPPGYKDKDKPYPEKYGDFIIWRQIIDKAKSEKKSIIFINDDIKEDWWLKINGKFVGPRYELLNEIFKEAQVKIYFYQSTRLIEWSKTCLDIEVSARVFSEIKKIKEISKQPENIVASNISSSQVVGSAENYVTTSIDSSAQDVLQLNRDTSQESIVQSNNNENKTFLKPKKKPSKNKK